MLKMANIGLRFLLELCALAAVGYWGFTLDKSIIWKVLAGIGLPLLIIVIWGSFGSPGAPYPLPGAYKYILLAAIFGFSAFALYRSGQQMLALVFIVIICINSLLMFIWKQ